MRVVVFSRVFVMLFDRKEGLKRTQVPEGE